MNPAKHEHTIPVFRRVLLASAAVIALSAPAMALDNYSPPAPPPTDPPISVTNAPMGGAGGVGGQGGAGGAGGHATATATARGGKGGNASVAITVDPVVAAPTTPATPTAAASDPSTTGRRTAGTGDPSGDPSGGHHHGGNGNLPVASAVAPWVGDNANPCTGASASIAVQTQLFGIGAGGNRMDYGCAGERMNNLETVGQQLDFAYQCLDDKRFAQAAYSIGHPCPADRQRYAHETGAMQPVAVPASATAAPTRPSYCEAGRGWTTAQLQARYQECR